ncbi:MAG TPA: response regulator [Candidatus Paceibacterota bacterium]|nr:response regulator [Verrucomicrobiota bacterium]HSA09810.1 response regulator [Candidatus Paceibacterota bacterium]
MKPTLLVVDDDWSVRDSLVKLLRSEGYEVHSARNGADTIVLFKSVAVDLVVLDLNLGADNGWDVFEAMNELNPRVPTVIITAESGQERRATAAGVEALIEKPIDVSVFLRIIRELLVEAGNGRLRRSRGHDAGCRYVARSYETVLKMLQERCFAPMELPSEGRIPLPPTPNVGEISNPDRKLSVLGGSILDSPRASEARDTQVQGA